MVMIPAPAWPPCLRQTCRATPHWTAAAPPCSEIGWGPSPKFERFTQIGSTAFHAILLRTGLITIGSLWLPVLPMMYRIETGPCTPADAPRQGRPLLYGGRGQPVAWQGVLGRDCRDFFFPICFTHATRRDVSSPEQIDARGPQDRLSRRLHGAHCARQ